MPSIHELVASARQRLREAGIQPAEADLDARILAQHLLGWDAARYFTDASRQGSEIFLAAYARAIARRVAREPVAYITGRQEFWGLSFEVSPAVLIPRPETELIVEIALSRRGGATGQQSSPRVADVCTGSGCVAIALATEWPSATIVATDVSAAALDVARVNAGRLGVADRVTFVCADLLAGLAGPFDLIVSNPPYVASGEEATLPPEVVGHEPHVALFAGRDGLGIIRRLVLESAARLAPAGALVFEFGVGQGEAIASLLAASGFVGVEIRRDLQGIPRTAVALRPAAPPAGGPRVDTGRGAGRE